MGQKIVEELAVGFVRALLFWAAATMLIDGCPI